jgi:hypothetical protein
MGNLPDTLVPTEFGTIGSQRLSLKKYKEGEVRQSLQMKIDFEAIE